MADSKISQLTEVTSPEVTDVLPIVNDSTTKKVQLDNLPVSTATQTALNGKEDTITGAATTITSTDLTASRALTSSATGKVEVSAVTSTELSYLDGVTSAVQTQVDAKISKSDGTTYDINALAAVTQAEYDALTPSATTLYFII